MGIPNKISPLTGGDILPRGYIAAEFLENQGAAYIIFSAPFNNAIGICVCQVQESITTDTAAITARTAELDQRFYSPYVFDSKWYIGWNGWIVINTDDGSAKGKKYEVKLNYYNDRKAVVKNSLESFSYDLTTTITENKVEYFRLCLYNRSGLFFKGKIYYVKMTEYSSIIRDFIPCINEAGKPCLYEKTSGQPFYTERAEFIVGMTIPQARYLRKLPVVESGALTVSLPWEAQWDTGVQNALTIAAARGWTITVQYRDPEVAIANIPISFVESNADSLIWFTAPTPAMSAEIELDIEYTQTRSSYQAACGIAGHTGNWVAVDGTRYMLYSAIEGTNVLERSIVLYKWYATPDSTVEGQSSLSVQGTTTTSFARNTTEATGIAMLNYDNGGWNPYYSFARVWSVRAKVGDWEVKGTPRLTTKGVPVMYDVASKTEYPPTKGNNFIAGFDTAIQARSLAYLPDVTAETDTAKKSLTVSLPWEAQLVTTYVPAALQIAADRGWTITVQYREPEADNEYYNRYAECVTYDDVLAINPNAKDDVTEDGAWVYKLPNLQSAEKSENVAIWRKSTTLKKFEVEMSSLISSGWGFQYSALEEFTGALPKLKKANACFMGTRLKKWTVDLPELTDSRNMYQETPMASFEAQTPKIVDGSQMFRSCTSLTTFVGALPLLSNGGYTFYGTKLNKESALRVFYSIPAYSSGTHKLTIGIHVDHKTDEEVIAAISNAEINGWELTVQWNGTATAAAASVSTFGLRSPAIYAKLGTVERPDGTTESVLDWGHYVTNWEENGYQEFSSVEEAEEHFNINQTEEAL